MSSAFRDSLFRLFRRHETDRAIVVMSPGVSVLYAIAGFLYVSGVLCGRPDPFRPAHAGHGGFVVAVVGFVVLSQAPRAWARAGANLVTAPFFDPAYTAAFVLFLHWQSFVRISGVDFTLATGGAGRFSPGSALVLAIASIIVTGLLAVHLKVARAAGLLPAYVAVLVAPQAVVAGVSLLLAGTHYLHYHHYLVGATLAAGACFGHPWSRVSSGALTGLFIEGLARWGPDPVWVPFHR